MKIHPTTTFTSSSDENICPADGETNVIVIPASDPHQPPRDVPHQRMHVPRSSSVWWYGVMFLSLCLITLVMFVFDITGVYPPTREGISKLKEGNWVHMSAFVVVHGILIQLPQLLVYTVLLRTACCTATTDYGSDPAHSSATTSSATGGYAGVTAGGVDRQALSCAGKWSCVYVALRVVGLVTMGYQWGTSALASLVVMLYLLPRQAARWLAAEAVGEDGGGGEIQSHHQQRARHLSSLFIRAFLVGIPLIVFQRSLVVMLRVMSAQQLSFIYPYTLSLLESVYIRTVLTDKAVEGHGDEALSIICRWCIAAIKVGRVGLIVVTYTTGAGTFQGFVLATLNSTLVEVLGRTGVLAVLLGALKMQCRHGWRWAWCGNPRPPFRLLPLSTLSRVKRVYLGCKAEIGYWPVAILAVMNLLDYGVYSLAHDPATGELLPALHCGAEVFAVVVAGEVLSDVGTSGAKWAVGRWCPRYSLDIVPVRPHRSLAVTVMMWTNVGLFTLSGLAGSGGLVEELEKDGGVQ